MGPASRRAQRSSQTGAYLLFLPPLWRDNLGENSLNLIVGAHTGQVPARPHTPVSVDQCRDVGHCLWQLAQPLCIRSRLRSAVAGMVSVGKARWVALHLPSPANRCRARACDYRYVRRRRRGHASGSSHAGNQRMEAKPWPPRPGRHHLGRIAYPSAAQALVRCSELVVCATKGRW
jgi:hypothetical protein